jgi:hypothetical protein
MVRRILIGVTFSWIMSATLSMVFAISTLGKEALGLPAVLPMTLSISSLISLLFSPLAVWAARTGPRNLLIYSPVLGGILGIHIVVGVRHWAPLSQASLFAIAVVGTVIIGFIPHRAPGPPRNRQRGS